jgi:hypothetical protein
MAVFMEERENAIRMFDQPPAHWARNGGAGVLSLTSAALVGEYFTFQAGIVANGPLPLTNMTVTYGSSSDGSGGNGGGIIPPDAFTCFNLGGNDQNGLEFSKNFTVVAGAVGALWFGVDLPTFASAPGNYSATIHLAASGGQFVPFSSPSFLLLRSLSFFPQTIFLGCCAPSILLPCPLPT